VAERLHANLRILLSYIPIDAKPSPALAATRRAAAGAPARGAIDAGPLRPWLLAEEGLWSGRGI